MDFNEFKKVNAEPLKESASVVPKETLQKSAMERYKSNKAVESEPAKSSATEDPTKLGKVIADPAVDIDKVIASNLKSEKKAEANSGQKPTNEAKKEKDDDEDDDDKDNEEITTQGATRHNNSSAKKPQNYTGKDGKKKVRLVPNKHDVTESESPFATFLESSGRGKRYKGATPPQTFDDNWSPLQKKLFQMHTIKSDPGADINKVISKNEKEMKKSVTLKPKYRPGDNPVGDKTPKSKG